MTKSYDGVKSNESSVEKPSAFRRILPQVIATTIKNLHMVDAGLTGAIPSIIIPALTGIPNRQNEGEFLSITASQASWLVSVGFLTPILGTLCSGLITDSMGRKRAMIAVNIPFIVGWLLLSQATQVATIFFGILLLGLSLGLMEASVMTYVGEISQASVRGILIAYSGMTSSIGALVVFLLNAWMPWRSVAFFCLLLPITCGILLYFVPETPHWLLSKKRTKQAEKSLQWLRGWTTKEVVAHEFYELQRHSERSNACYSCIKQDLHCLHPSPTLAEKLSELKRKQTLKPLAIIFALFFLVNFTGGATTRPFIQQIFKAYESPIPIDNAMMLLGVSDNLAKVIFVCLIRFTGKRKIYLTMLSGVFISSLVISCYGYIYLPKGFVSFGQQNQTFHLENLKLAYIPTISLFVLHFCTLCGFATMPWVMVSELFPFKSRAIASALSAALYCIMGFLSSKTYYNLEMTLSLPGTSLFYSVIGGLGLILMYFILPETEGRTLEDIEQHFSDNSKKLTDRKIMKKSQILLDRYS